MNKRQLIVQRQFVQDEKAVIKELKHEYSKALAQVNDKIKILQADEMTQSKIYQLEYQLSLRQQISDILDNMRSNNYQTVENYLNKCYEEGFLGAMYDIQGQGIPLIFPIDQKQLVKAVQLDSKISKGLYGRMGLNVNELKKQISSEISRGISTGQSFERIAGNLKSAINGDYSKSLRIIRTEGHRIQTQSALDAMIKAKDKGADIVKQWDSTLDSNTRPEHAELDGQVRELDEDFTVGSYSAPCPGSFGDPYMDCNCRCAILQRARWAVNNETSYQKMNNETGELIECSGFDDFKEKYWNAVDKRAERGIIKTEGSLKLNMQFFAEKDIANQESGSLKRAMRKYQVRIDEHKDKIANPEKYVTDWASYDDRKKQGLKRHWQKEINNFEESIQNRIDELKKRGDYDE